MAWLSSGTSVSVLFPALKNSNDDSLELTTHDTNTVHQPITVAGRGTSSLPGSAYARPSRSTQKEACGSLSLVSHPSTITNLKSQNASTIIFTL